MSKFIPPIVTVDNIVDMHKNAKQIVINKQPYIARSCSHKTCQPYYSNVIKRVVASFYVLFGKGMVVCYSEDMYKAKDVRTVSYK